MIKRLGQLIRRFDSCEAQIQQSAAGRTAVGIPSRSYVSGLSIADCIYSGRRAGKHAAAQCADILSIKDRLNEYSPASFEKQTMENEVAVAELT